MEPNIQLDSILQLWAVQTKDDFFRLNSEMLNTQAGSKQVNKNARVREGMMIFACFCRFGASIVCQNQYFDVFRSIFC